MDEYDFPETKTKTPSFMDLFGVHLALRLVGKESLLKHLNAVPVNSFPLYWRTPLLDDASSKVMFLDATVTFDPLEISTTFGVLLRQSNNHFCYIKTSPLTFSQLANHTQNVGIDLDSTAPDAMARTMGSALIGSVQGNDNADKIQCFDGGNDKITVSVPLHYTDLQEKSPLVIESATISKLDASTSEMLQSNFVQQDELMSKVKTESNETIDTSIDTQVVSSEVLHAFEIWWNASATRHVESNQHDSHHSKLEGCTIVSNTPGKSCTLLPQKPYNTVDTTEANEGAHNTHLNDDSATSKTAAPTEGGAPSSKRTQVTGYVRVTTTKRRRKLGFASAVNTT